MPRTHRPCALIASAGLLISAHAASAQFDTFTGDIQLDGVPVVLLGFDFMGTLALASIGNPVDAGGFDAQIVVTPGATITHIGDMVVGSGLNTLSEISVGSGASWTTTGTLDHGSGTNLSGRLNLDTDASLSIGGDFVMANNPGSGALFEALAGSSTSIGGDFTASAGSDAPTFFTIDGAGATLDIAGSIDMGSGDASFGFLELIEGVVANVGGDFTMGSGSNSSFNLAVGDGSECHIGGHAAFGPSAGESSLDISVDDASILTSASMSISGRAGMNGTGSGVDIDSGSSFLTGALDVSDGAQLDVRAGSTANAGVTRVEGTGTRLRALNASRVQLDSLTITDNATARAQSGSTLEIAGDLTFEPALEEPLSTVLVVNGATSTLSVGGDIVGDASVIDFVSGFIEIGGDFTLTSDLDGGFLNYNGNRSLTVGGLLGVESAVTLSSGSTVRAGRMTEAGINTITSGSGDLIVDVLVLENAGQTTTTLPTFTTTATLSIAGVQNKGVLEAAFLDAYPDLGIVNAATGEIRLGEGDDVNPAWIDNNGRLELIGRNVLGGLASIDTPGTLENGAGGVIFAQESEIRTAGGFTNDGTLGYTFGRSSVFGEFVNTGLITITGGSEVTFFDDVTNNGTINLAQGGSLTGATTVFGTYSGAGNVSGGGDLFLLGDVQVGNSPADVEWDASLFLGPTSDTLIEIAGTEIGDFDRFSLTGDLGLAGDVDVVFLDGFLLQEGMRFEIFAAQGTKTGAFNGFAEGDIVGTFNGVDLFITYDNEGLGNVALFSVPTPGAAALLLTAGLFSRRRRA